MRKIVEVLINFFFRLFPIDNKKVLFISTNYRLNDNPYALFRYLKEHNPGYRLVYLVAKDADVSSLQKGEYAYVRSLMGLYHMATYKYRFTCQSYGSIIKKRPGQRYIQLWHATFSLKKMGFDIANSEGLTQLPHTIDWDYYISASENDVQVIKGCSGFTCPYKLLGNPRTDALFAPWDLSATRKKLGISEGKRVLLYAPTFRDWELDAETVTLPNLSALTDEYTVLVRLHPFVADKLDPQSLSDGIVNVCGYPDLNELLAVSDVLVTDYSSVFIDFSLLEKPAVFYIYDYETYVKERGGFYLDFKTDLPGPVAFSEEELLKALYNLKPDLKKIRAFNQIHNTFNDGKVSQRVAEELFNGNFDC